MRHALWAAAVFDPDDDWRPAADEMGVIDADREPAQQVIDRVSAVPFGAVQWTGDNLDAIATLAGDRWPGDVAPNPPADDLIVDTPDGEARCHVGDWLIRSTDDEFHVGRNVRGDTGEHRSPTTAAIALAERLLRGATCRCRAPVTLSDDREGCRWRLVGQRCAERGQ